MVHELAPVVAAGYCKLSVQRSRVYPDAHARELECAAERLVPDQDIPVEAPVVVVGRAPVVRFAGLERRADADDEGRAMLAQILALALLRRQLRPAVLQLLRGDEADLTFYLSQ